MKENTARDTKNIDGLLSAVQVRSYRDRIICPIATLFFRLAKPWVREPVVHCTSVEPP